MLLILIRSLLWRNILVYMHEYFIYNSISKNNNYSTFPDDSIGINITIIIWEILKIKTFICYRISFILYVVRMHITHRYSDVLTLSRSYCYISIKCSTNIDIWQWRETKHGARVETSITLSCNFFTNMNHKFHYSRNEILRNRSSCIYRHACYVTLNVTCAVKQFTAKCILKLSKLPHLTCDISVCCFHLIFQHVSHEWMVDLPFISISSHVLCGNITRFD